MIEFIHNTSVCNDGYMVKAIQVLQNEKGNTQDWRRNVSRQATYYIHVKCLGKKKSIYLEIYKNI